MTQKILIVNGHPDPASRRLCHSLVEAYGAGASGAGHAVRRIDVAALQFGLLRSQNEFEHGAPVADIAAAQESIRWADHLAVVFPLWLGDMPAILKAFFEQTLRPGFAFNYRPRGLPEMRLEGRSARIVLTMGMPALIYRWYFRAHGLKNLKRNILGSVGFSPVRDTVLGSIAARSKPEIERWLDEMRALGSRAA